MGVEWDMWGVTMEQQKLIGMTIEGQGMRRDTGRSKQISMGIRFSHINQVGQAQMLLLKT
jgi:hypothetical protein